MCVLPPWPFLTSQPALLLPLLLSPDRIASAIGAQSVAAARSKQESEYEVKRREFHIDPADGFSDPMYDHFHSGFGFIGGGGGGTLTLGEKPQLITCELNQRFRFDRPGKYRLYINSPRVTPVNKDDQSGSVILTSNAIEFEIVPADRAWQEKELQRAIQAIDAKDRTADRQTTCRVLRFLGSMAAAAEMIRRFGDSDDECRFEYYAGLIGSPHRDFAIEKMESHIALPDQPVSNGWLDLLAR